MRVVLAVFVAALLPAAALGIAAPAAFGAAAPPLVAQWHMDDTSGADTSGNGLNGTTAGGVSVVPGRFGNALQSASVPILNVADNPLLRPSQLSLMLWFKQSGNPGTLKYLVSAGGEGPGGCNGSPFAIYTHYIAGKGPTFYIRGVGGGHLSASAGTGVFDGNWHLLVGTFDGTQVRFFVDGVEVGSPTPALDTIDYSVATVKDFRVGEYSGQVGCGPSSVFPGPMDEVRLYDRALSATEIARLAAATGPAPPVLVPDGGGGGGGGGGAVPTPVGPAPIVLGPGQGPNPPRIFSVQATAAARFGRPALVTVGVEGASQIDWDLSGDGKTDLSCGGNDTTLGVRATSGYTRAATGGATKLISFRAISPGGVATAPSQLLLPTSPKPASVPAPSTKPAGGKLLSYSDLGFCAISGQKPGDVVNGIGKLLSLSLNCTDQTVAFGIVETKGCFVHANSFDALPSQDHDKIVAEYRNAGGNPSAPVDMWLSSKPIKLNGLDINPFGAPVVVFPALGRVVSRSAGVKFGSITVRSTGAINLDVRAQAGARHTDLVTGQPINNGALGQSGGATIDAFDARKSLRAIGGFPLDAQAQLQLWSENGRRFSEATLHLNVPDIFTAFGGKPPSAGTRIVADNRTAPSFDGLDVRVPELSLGAVELTDVAFHYNANGHATEPTCGAKYWSATANVFIGDKSSQNGRAGFRLAPDPPQNGVHFCGGGFLAAGGEVLFGGPIPPPVIFPGVTLQAIRLGIQVDPPLVHGGVTLDVAKLATVKGDLLVVLASPGSPYTLTTADAPSFAGVSGTRLVAPTVAVGGEVALKTPLGDLGFGSAHFLYEYPDYVDLGGSVSVVVPGVRVTGSLRGQFRGSTGQFNVEGGVRGCLGVDLFCGSANGWVSDRGVAICVGDIVHDDWVPGVGYGWGAVIPDIWFPTGCKPSRYWDHSIAAPRSAQAGAPVTFTVSAGETVKSVELLGAGGKPPAVTLTAPGGETVSVGPDTKSIVHGKTIGLARESEHGIVVAGVLDGKPGTYTVTPADGSPTIVKVKETRGDDGDGVTARVRREGEKYVLEYDAGPVGGKEVTFVEQAPGVAHVVKTVRGGVGKVVFEPQDGRAGTREIVAQTTLDDKPTPDLPVARFAVGDRVTPGAVRGVKARRIGRRLVVTWDAAVNADRYGITLRQANGNMKTLTVRAGVERATISGLSEQFAGTVSVSAQGGLPGVFGRADTEAFKATEAEDTAFLSYRELGRKAKSR